jgi:DNA polymerase-3 subunit delta'
MNTACVDERVLERFQRLVSTGRMGHAYLFVGPKDTGKTETALTIAQLVNCEAAQAKPCFECPSCRKIANGNHPDVMVMEEDEGSIKIEQIRFLVGRLQLKAYEAKTKVFIIRLVETMTLQAANSLLKTLEEPASNTLMILTTANPEANLDTIRSRCHLVKFFPASLEHMREALGDDPAAQFLSVYTDGCVGQAKQLQEQDFMRLKGQIIDGFLNGSNDESSKKSAEKEDVKESLRIFLSIIRDAYFLKTGVSPEALMNADRFTQVKELSTHSFEELSAIYQQVVRTTGLLNENFNAKMAFNILRQRI